MEGFIASCKTFRVEGPLSFLVCPFAQVHFACSATKMVESKVRQRIGHKTIVTGKGDARRGCRCDEGAEVGRFRNLLREGRVPSGTYQLNYGKRKEISSRGSSNVDQMRSGLDKFSLPSFTPPFPSFGSRKS